MQTTETTAKKEIPLASVNTAYKSVTVDGNTTNMDEGTVWRGLGVITGKNSSRLLMDCNLKQRKIRGADMQDSAAVLRKFPRVNTQSGSRSSAVPILSMQ